MDRALPFANMVFPLPMVVPLLRTLFSPRAQFPGELGVNVKPCKPIHLCAAILHDCPLRV